VKLSNIDLSERIEKEIGKPLSRSRKGKRVRRISIEIAETGSHREEATCSDEPLTTTFLGTAPSREPRLEEDKRVHRKRCRGRALRSLSSWLLKITPRHEDRRNS
jgi:hypothetical protein